MSAALLMRGPGNLPQLPSASYGARELKASLHRYMAWGVTLSAILGVGAIVGGEELSRQLARLLPPAPTHPDIFKVFPIIVPHIFEPPDPGPPPTAPPARDFRDGAITLVKDPSNPPDISDFAPPTSALAPDLKIAIGRDEAAGNQRQPRAESGAAPKPGAPDYPDVLPVALGEVKPDYPEIARLNGIEGRVSLLLLVGLDGRVEEVQLEQGVKVLNGAALEAARRMLFRPAETRGRPVRVWVRQVFDFRLRG